MHNRTNDISYKLYGTIDFALTKLRGPCVWMSINSTKKWWKNIMQLARSNPTKMLKKQTGENESAECTHLWACCNELVCNDDRDGGGGGGAAANGVNIVQGVVISSAFSSSILVLCSFNPISATACPWAAKLIVMEPMHMLCQTLRNNSKALLKSQSMMFQNNYASFGLQNRLMENFVAPKCTNKENNGSGIENGTFLGGESKLPVPLSVLFTVLYICMNTHKNK